MFIEITPNTEKAKKELQHTKTFNTSDQYKTMQQSSQPYAPITSYSTNYSSSTNPLYFNEISLSSSSKEHEINESCRLYSIITTLEIVEKSYLKDNISNDDYTQIVSKLISQYTTILKQQDVSSKFISLEKFIETYQMNVSNAKNRLDIGIPVTIEHSFTHSQSHQNSNLQTSHSNNSSNGNNNSKLIVETTGNFITLMDALKLNYKAKDQLYPLLSDLITNLSKLSKDETLITWLIKLNKMNVLDELNEEDIRKFLFDLDNGYKEFYSSV